jgi:hypothetical protein
MLSLRRVPVLAADARAACGLATLPQELIAVRILPLLPAESKLRIMEVCHAFYALLASDRAAWAKLDLAGCQHPRPLALLRAAMRRAGSALEVLDVRDCHALQYAGFVRLLASRGRTLRELDVRGTFSDGSWTDVEQLAEIVVAAPQLRMLHADVIMRAARMRDVSRLLRGTEAWSAAVHIRELFLGVRCGDTRRLRALGATEFAAHPALRRVTVRYTHECGCRHEDLAWARGDAALLALTQL